MARRLVALAALSLAFIVLAPAMALACGGLVAPGHAEVLRRATTLAAWHDGKEHYVTGFQFAGSAHSFGYIIPLPGEPSKIQKGGEWTLERLQIEVSPVAEGAALRLAAAPAADSVQVLQQVRVEALDITVVRGGGRDVTAWARQHGFDLTPDTGDIMEAYSSKGAIFALAKFDNEEAARRGLVEGAGTVIHFTIPTEAPWIPLRILSLGKHGTEVVNADLFVLTDDRPWFAPRVESLEGMSVLHSDEASTSLLQDLRSDKGMGWMPAEGMWLTALKLEADASTIGYDLSINGGGPVPLSVPGADRSDAAWVWWVTALTVIAGAGITWSLWRTPAPPMRPA